MYTELILTSNIFIPDTIIWARFYGSNSWYICMQYLNEIIIPFIIQTGIPLTQGYCS